MPDRILPSGAVVNMTDGPTIQSNGKKPSDYGYTQTAGAGRGFVNPPTSNDSNAFAHQPDNVVPGSESAQGLDPGNVAVEFQPNLLDNYDAVTYHWKFFMTTPSAARDGLVLTPNVQTMIAESGVTDLTIDNVLFRAIAVPTIQTGTGTMTEVSFEIVEPAGAGLMDKMFYQSISLGIQNWNTIPYFLQLEFRARDPENSNSDINLGPNAIGNLKWVWAIKINDIKANVSTVGTRYKFTALYHPEVAQSNTYYSIQHNVILKSILTVGDAIAELEDKINFDQREKLIDNYGIADVYKIYVDGGIAKYNITPPNNNTNSIRNNSYDVFDEKSATFNTGTSIDKIIDTLLANTNEFQTLMVHSVTPGEEGVSINKEPSQMKKFWRIVTNTRILEFDARRNDYAREFTIYVIPYDIGLLQSNTFQSEDETKQTSMKRFLTYIKKNILKKKYNYIFTGLNDQIISFDLDFNMSFASAVARYGGIYINSAMPDKGVVNNNRAEEEKEITQKLQRELSFIHSNQSTQSLLRSIDNFHETLNASTLSTADQEKYRKILQSQKPTDSLTTKTVNQPASTFEESKKYAQTLARPLADNLPAFVSDVDIKSPAAISVYSEYMTSRKSSMRPVAHIEQVQDTSAGQGLEPNSNSGIAKLSTMFSIALHSPDINLINLKLTIKGDPFWLFPGPLSSENESIYKFKDSPTAAIEYLKNNQRMQNTSVNFSSTDNFLLLRFRTPRVYSDVTSPASVYNPETITDVETYSGVYKVTFVTSKFEMGRFVQIIEGFLDTEINLRDISALIEEDARKLDIPLTVEGFRKERQWDPNNPISTYNRAPVTAPTPAPTVVPQQTPANTPAPRINNTLFNRQRPR